MRVLRALKTVAIVLLNYVLSAAAMILPLLLYLLNTVAQVLISVKSTSSLKVASEMAKKNAINISIFYNNAYKELWKILIFKSGFHAEIGNPNETFSYVIARAWKASELTWIGYIVGGCLNIIFFWEIPKGGHLNMTINAYDN